MLATVLRAIDDHLVVRVNGTDVQRQVRLGADAWPLNDSESANTRDACALNHTHPPALLRWLQARFAAGSFFGDVGPDVLLYVNPLAPEPALWDEGDGARVALGRGGVGGGGGGRRARGRRARLRARRARAAPRAGGGADAAGDRAARRVGRRQDARRVGGGAVRRVARGGRGGRGRRRAPADAAAPPLRGGAARARLGADGAQRVELALLAPRPAAAAAVGPPPRRRHPRLRPRGARAANAGGDADGNFHCYYAALHTANAAAAAAVADGGGGGESSLPRSMVEGRWRAAATAARNSRRQSASGAARR